MNPIPGDKSYIPPAEGNNLGVKKETKIDKDIKSLVHSIIFKKPIDDKDRRLLAVSLNKENISKIKKVIEELHETHSNIDIEASEKEVLSFIKQSALSLVESHLNFKQVVKSFNEKVKSLSSEKALQHRQQFLNFSGLEFSPSRESVETSLKNTLTVLKTIEKTSSIDELHEIALIFQSSLDYLIDNESSPSLIKLNSALKNLISFMVGLRTIDIAFADSDPDVKKAIKEFYIDEKHPMDLQNCFRDKDTAISVSHIITNLIQSIEIYQNRLGDVATNEDVSKYNDFISSLILSHPVDEKNSLINIPTVLPQVQQTRDSNGQYFGHMGLSQEFINEHLSFSTSYNQKGIYLFPKDYDPDYMKSVKIHEQKDFVYLRVPDAEGRIVRISSKGYEALHTIQMNSALNLRTIQKRLQKKFKPEDGFVVTGRTKSPMGILDKTGRLCSITQIKDTNKETVKDIIDINGCRITCKTTQQIAEVINSLKEMGFEFLELDNKYNTIRKDGAYKVIPTTIRDPETGNIFELQLTTLTSLAVNDLYHNVIYKKEAIGLDLDDKERNKVLSLQRYGAMLETMSLLQRKIVDFTQDFKQNRDVIKEIFDNYIP